jgi:hypothetical protein
VTPFLVVQHSSTAASIRPVTCDRNAEPRARRSRLAIMRVCDDYKIEGGCCRQVRGWPGSAEAADDRRACWGPRLAAVSRRALALGRTSGKRAWAAPLQGWHPRAPGGQRFLPR